MGRAATSLQAVFSIATAFLAVGAILARYAFLATVAVLAMVAGFMLSAVSERCVASLNRVSSATNAYLRMSIPLNPASRI